MWHYILFTQCNLHIVIVIIVIGFRTESVFFSTQYAVNFEAAMLDKNWFKLHENIYFLFSLLSYKIHYIRIDLLSCIIYQSTATAFIIHQTPLKFGLV
jgi:hypothetical protein